LHSVKTIGNRDIPLQIMRDKRFTYQQKAFLLWCWINKTSSDRCELMSCRDPCMLRDRNVQWYADFLGMHRNSMWSFFAYLVRLGVLKVEHEGTRNECSYIDFSVYA
jgi:hypothetical protein